jgi:hypothetical protein
MRQRQGLVIWIALALGVVLLGGCVASTPAADSTPLSEREQAVFFYKEAYAIWSVAWDIANEEMDSIIQGWRDGKTSAGEVKFRCDKLLQRLELLYVNVDSLQPTPSLQKLKADFGDMLKSMVEAYRLRVDGIANSDTDKMQQADQLFDEFNKVVRQSFVEEWEQGLEHYKIDQSEIE